LIDVQERLFPHIHKHDELSERIQILLQGFKILDVPIIATEQYVKGLGSTVPEIADHLEGVNRYEKMTFSCCGSEDFMDELMHNRKKEIVLFGIEAHVCVQQTMLDMINRGLKVIIVTDCISSRKQYDKEIAIKRMIHEGAHVATSESILFELCKEAGNDTFRAISKLVK
jgi:hypothetical protein